MIEIAPARLLPLATLLSLALAAAIATAIVVATWHLRDRAARLTMVAVVAGIVLGAASAVFRSSRGAGTGTHTAWGWPRAVYTRWVSWETSEQIRGIRLRGVAENAVFYATLAALAGSVGLASRRLLFHNGEERT
jgi:hypothetical protein